MANEGTTERTDDALLLDAALETIPFGFCVWNSNLTLSLWNRHYLDIYGFPERAIHKGMSLFDLVSLSCALGNHPQTDPQSFFNAYSAELQANRDGTRVVTLEHTANGRTLETSHVYAPGLGWVVTHEDVTEDIARAEMMEDRKQELERQYGLLDAAINNIDHGLSMFDENFQLVASNAAFARMYGLPPELTRQGTAFRDILLHRQKTGLHAPDNIETHLAERARIMREGKAMKEVVRMADGTTILFRQQPLKGGGLVTTHEDITGQMATEARLRHLATHDSLTDLPNRTLFRESIDLVCRKSRKAPHFGLLLINLDHFRTINDNDGQDIGDKVLRRVASRLSELIGTRGTVARLGGDEFAILINALSDPQDAAILAAAIIRTLSRPLILGRRKLRVGVSIGIAVAPLDGSTADTLLNNADLALSRAKSEGRGTYHFFESGMDEKLQRRRTLEASLRDALATQSFRLNYQPIVAAESGKIICAEALLRWTHPDLGPIAPGEFIPIAEEAGLIADIGGWVLATACRDAALWREPVQVAVNLSPLQFARKTLPETVADAIRSARLDPRRLVLEITETLMLEDNATNLETLHRLRNLGIGIAMDDFGTGYSSLSYLRAFPFDKIKIDRSFMIDIAEKPDNRAILKAMIGLGTSLGMGTVVEGVETAEQYAIARAEGCTEVQGYFFSPPLANDAFEALLARGDLGQTA